LPSVYCGSGLTRKLEPQAQKNRLKVGLLFLFLVNKKRMVPEAGL